MNLAITPAVPAPPAAPTPQPAAAPAEPAGDQSFSRMLQSATRADAARASERRAAARTADHGDRKAAAESSARPDLKPGLKARTPSEADAPADARADAHATRLPHASDARPEPAVEKADDAGPAAEEREDTSDKVSADPAALLASLLGAVPRPAQAAVPQGSARDDTAAAASPAAATPAHARADALDATRAGTEGSDRPSSDRGDSRDDAAASARAAADTPAFTPPALQGPAATVAGAPLPPAADAAATGADPRIAAPVHGPEFAPALGAQVSLLVREGVQEARLQLNPAEMGPITVQIQLDGQNAQVVMSAEQAGTRERLEQALPALAGALREDGLILTGGGVFEQPRQSQERPAQDQPRGAQSTATPDAARKAAAEAAVPVRRTVARGGVDLYA